MKLGPHIKGKMGSESLRIGWYGRHVGFVNRQWEEYGKNNCI